MIVVLFIICVLYLAGTSVAALVLVGIAKWAIHRRGDQSGILRHAALLPFVVLLLYSALFAVRAYVSPTYLDRDRGIGWYWRCPLPVGYAVSMYDGTDHGRLTSLDGQRKPVITRVRTLQVSGDYLLGGTASKIPSFSSRLLRDEELVIDGYFLLHARSGQFHRFDSLDALTTEASGAGVTVGLAPIYDVYARYRPSPIDHAANGLVAGVSLAGLASLAWRIRKIRQRS